MDNVQKKLKNKRMGRRNEHTQEQQREMALVAAELILMREGIAGLSMRKVSEAIGYTVGNLYLLFQNQDDLLLALNQRTADAINAELSAQAAEAAEGEARLLAIADRYIQFGCRHPHRWRLMFEHQLPPGMDRSGVEMRLARLFGVVESALKPLMPTAKPARLRLAAASLWSGVHGVAVLAVTGKLRWSGGEDPAPFAHFLVQTFLAGLPKPKA